MRRLARTILPALGLLSLGTASAAHAQYNVYGLNGTGTGQQLVLFNSGTPAAVSTLGLTGANLVGIDFRPATGVLYGYDGSLLYTVNRGTGAATQIFDVGNTAGNPGFDFNPVADRIRVTGASGTNLRLNQITGATIVDSAYRYAAGDVNFGATPSFQAVAYTNSVSPTPTATALFGIDANLGQLIRITNPNGGAVNTVGSLGLGFVPNVTGFDIVTVGTANFGFFSTLAAGAAVSNFYSIDLETGQASLVGPIGTGSQIQDIAIAAVPEPGTWALLGTGLIGLAGIARRRRA